MTVIAIEPLTDDAFAPYGDVLDTSDAPDKIINHQAFIPMSMDPFMVVVAADDGGQPAKPRAFITTAGQGINFHRNTWHGVLTPIKGTGLFAVVDRIGDGPNLEEHWFETPYTIRSLV